MAACCSWAASFFQLLSSRFCLSMIRPHRLCTVHRTFGILWHTEVNMIYDQRQIFLSKVPEPPSFNQSAHLLSPLASPTKPPAGACDGKTPRKIPTIPWSSFWPFQSHLPQRASSQPWPSHVRNCLFGWRGLWVLWSEASWAMASHSLHNFQMDTQSRCHEGTGIVCHSFKQKRQVDAVYSYIHRFGSAWTYLFTIIHSEFQMWKSS